MYSRDTHYILLQYEKEYETARRFILDEGERVLDFTFPTILAIRDTSIMGIMGSRKEDWGYVALPVHVAKCAKNPAIIMLRLFEAYEGVLRTINVDWFSLPVPKGKPPCCPSGYHMLEKLRQTELYHEGEHCLWYIVRVPILEEEKE